MPTYFQTDDILVIISSSLSKQLHFAFDRLRAGKRVISETKLMHGNYRSFKATMAEAETWERENMSDIVELVNDVGFTYFYFISDLTS